jgi:phosphocarrier protein HPr
MIMNHPSGQFAKDVIINNPLGLHARAAAKIAAIVKNVKANVWIIKDGEKVDASSVIEILTLACAQGSKITITIDDQSDVNILNDLVKLVESNFGE